MHAMRLPLIGVGILVGTLAAIVVPARGGAAPAAPLRFAWANGSQLEVRGKTYVWCGKWDDGANVRTLRIQQSSPFSPPWWFIEIRVTIARRGRQIAFPTLSGRTATMFVAYPRRQLEASADSERSRGSVKILADVSCRPGSPVRLSIRARLASEEAGPSIDARGTIAGSVGTTAAPGVQP
jgi:hypothetical protein